MSRISSLHEKMSSAALHAQFKGSTGSFDRAVVDLAKGFIKRHHDEHVRKSFNAWWFANRGRTAIPVASGMFAACVKLTDSASSTLTR